MMGASHPSINTRNIALGNTSVILPSSFTPSSLANCKLYPFHPVPPETAPLTFFCVPNYTYIWIGLALGLFLVSVINTIFWKRREQDPALGAIGT